MRRMLALSLVALTLAGSGCSLRSSRTQAAPPTPAVEAPNRTEPDPVLSPPPATARPGGESAGQATLAGQIAQALNEPGQTPAQVLSGLAGPAGSVIEADLNGDGAAEWVAGITTQGERYQRGTLVVAYRKDGKYSVDVQSLPDVRTAQVKSVADLTGDGRPEIVWFSEDHGAHTSYADVYASDWEPGKFTLLPGKMYITMPEIEVEGGEVVLRGGMVGSAGAGVAQRRRTDRYRWVDGAFKLIDRAYAPSSVAYHRLIDGIVAEEFRHGEAAAIAYREAAEPDRPVGKAGWAMPGQEAPFAEAVRAFARFRLGVLLLGQGKSGEVAGADGPFAGLTRAPAGAGSREAGCKAGASWAADHPEFLEALNSPMGYANPRWGADDLCGPLPDGE